ncbi:MAG: NAD-dependent succinate-semialdehyde dehydrogenase [Legionella sp.]|nr:NAD-dependent succinate-semialdehyde dehydrogenase [Legionella sp.]
MIIQSVNPATEVVIQEYNTLSEVNTIAVVDKAYFAFTSWRNTEFSVRRQLMLNLSELLLLKIDELSVLITNEMGKPVTQARAEIEKCALVCQHYAELAEKYLKPRAIKTEMAKTKVCYQALGVIFGIMPWNFPFWQVFRFAAPTIMAGNAVILKHAPISIGAGNAIAALFIEAGFPTHLFQHAILNNDMAAFVIAHEKVAALSFTGSEKTGRIVSALAASHLKKSVLELGGSDPYMVLADADIELAARSIVTSRLTNCGQVCIAAKRIIVLESVHDELIKKISTYMGDYKMGDPLNPKATLGPMARFDLREVLHQQVIESVEKGAILLSGGRMVDRQGFYYPPTLLTNVCKGMPAFDEELFGPVIAIIKVHSEDEAIALANASNFGLAAAVFTSDLIRGEEIATHKIEAGSCFVNAVVASDPRVPFGGIKHSGYGRELSREGILEFVNTKTVAIK